MPVSQQAYQRWLDLARGTQMYWDSPVYWLMPDEVPCLEQEAAQVLAFLDEHSHRWKTDPSMLAATLWKATKKAGPVVLDWLRGFLRRYPGAGAHERQAVRPPPTPCGCRQSDAQLPVR